MPETQEVSQSKNLLARAHETLKALIPDGEDTHNYIGETINSLVASDRTIATIDKLGLHFDELPKAIRQHPTYHALVMRAAINAVIFAQDPDLAKQIWGSAEGDTTEIRQQFNGRLSEAFNFLVESTLQPQEE